MNNFWTRAISGAVFVALLSWASLFSAVSFAGLALLVIYVGTREFYRMIGLQSKPLFHWGTYLGLHQFISFYLYLDTGMEYPQFLFSNVPLILLTLIFELFKKNEQPLINVATTILGSLYLSIPMASLLFMAYHPYDGSFVYDGWNILGFFILIWTSDTGAYLSGKSFGKHKLFERISPGKTWEGTIGGGVLALIAGYLLGHFNLGFDSSVWMMLAPIAVVFGTLGDLCESMLKRSVGVKDSGQIMPGHGGILDRFDAVLLAAPFALSLIVLVIEG